MGLVMFIVLGLLVGVVVGSLLPAVHRGPLPAVIGMTSGLLFGTGTAALVGMNPLTQAWSFAAWVGAIAGAVIVMALYALITEPGTTPGLEMTTGSGDRTTSGRG